MISFCRVWYLVIWYASRLAIALNLPEPLSMTKKCKPQNRDTLKSPWLMPWGTLIKNCPFLGNPSNHNPFPCWHKWNTFKPYPFFGQDMNNPWAKRRPLLKIILTWGVVLQSGSSSIACVIARSRRIIRTKEEKKGENWLSCHALEKKSI